MKQFDAEISVQKGQIEDNISHYQNISSTKILNLYRAISHSKTYFVRHHSDSIHNYSDVDIKAMFGVPH